MKNSTSGAWGDFCSPGEENEENHKPDATREESRGSTGSRRPAGTDVAPRRMMRALNVGLGLLLFTPAGAPAAAELEPRTVAAYDRYIAGIDERFAPQLHGRLSIGHAAPETDAHLRDGTVLVWPGTDGGILEVPGGLIHHWRAAAFIRGATLQSVLGVAQHYAAYPEIYPWVVRSALLDHDPRQPDTGPRSEPERFRVLLRIERRARGVTSVLDVWSSIRYQYTGEDRAASTSNADCIRQVEEAGTTNERRLPAGTGSGYLWRANTYTTYLQRHGGVYVDLQTIGLSRRLPPLLGWLIKPIVRDVGRASAAESLRHLREAVLARAADASAGRSRRAPSPAPTPAGWCD